MGVKILLSAVGNTDPFGSDGKSDGPVLGAVDFVKPEVAMLFPTAEQAAPHHTATIDGSYRTKAEIERRHPGVKVIIRPLDLPDPTLYPAIIKAFRDEVRKIQATYNRSNPQYWLSITSGTAQMQAAWLFLVNSNILRATVLQVRDPKRILPEEPRVREVDTEWVLEEFRLKRAQELFENYAFKEAAGELELLGASTHRLERGESAQLMANLSLAYAEWDFYHPDEAGGRLKEVEKEFRRFGISELWEVVKDQLLVLSEIERLGKEEGPVNLIDLYFNAQRRMKQGQYTDVLTRVKRLMEGLICYHGRIKLGKGCDDLPYLGLAERLEEAGHINLGVLMDQIKLVGNKRNSTIAAHGMRGGTREEAQEALNVAEKLIKKVLDKKDLEGYIFSPERIKAISREVFLRI